MKSATEYVVLNKDQKAVTLEGLKKLSQVASHMHKLVQNDTLSEDMKGKLLSLAEFHLTDVAKEVNYEANLAKEREKFYAEIREKHKQIEELEEKLANANPIDGLQEQLKTLSGKVEDWWRELGFTFISDMDFSSRGGGLQITFAFSLESYSRMFSKTPISDKEKEEDKIQSLRDKGFTIINDGSELCLAATDNNQALLISLLQERFPSIQIQGMETAMGIRDTTKMHMRYVKAYIQDVRDI